MEFFPKSKWPINLSYFWSHVMFAIISGSNSLNLTNLLASDTHHQFHNLCLQMCFPGEALSFFRVSCVQLQLGLHWAFLFPPWQQHGTEERLLNIRHVYSYYSLFTGSTNNCAGAFRRQWKKKSFLLALLLDRNNFLAYSSYISRNKWQDSNSSDSNTGDIQDLFDFLVCSFRLPSRYSDLRETSEVDTASELVRKKTLGIWLMQK